jgi:aspartate kinase
VVLGTAPSLDRLVDAATRADIGLRDLSAGAAGVAFAIPLLNVPDWARARAALVSAVPGVELREGASVVSVVGDGLASSAEPLGRALGALREAGAEPARVVAGPLRIGAAIAHEHLAAAQRALHAAFVG